MKMKTEAEWMDLARQHSKTMTLAQVKKLYGAEPVIHRSEIDKSGDLKVYDEDGKLLDTVFSWTLDTLYREARQKYLESLGYSINKK